jgi:hypothetical protein
MLRPHMQAHGNLETGIGLTVSTPPHRDRKELCDPLRELLQAKGQAVPDAALFGLHGSSWSLIEFWPMAMMNPGMFPCHSACIATRISLFGRPLRLKGTQTQFLSIVRGTFSIY